MLTEAHYSVMTASNGKDALELYETHREEIKLVILNLAMPQMDGRECLLALRRMDPKIRILVASGALKEGMEEDLKETGAKGVIRKPFNMSLLLEKIQKIIYED
ncbi:MAG: response regulator [Deltaproteobacteria bacterium]|nr:response regulator [Deltaproteobacteria bacterium]